MGRSFKYHRPRGPLTSGSEEPNAIVELREGARKEPTPAQQRLNYSTVYTQIRKTVGLRWPSMSWRLMIVVPNS